MSTIGFRVFDRPERHASNELLHAFQKIGTAQISDCMQRLYGVVGLTPFHASSAPRMVGRALTVKTRPGDNLLIHKAILMSRPGDILVVDGGGELTNALVGELMAMDAQNKYIAGFLIDGAIRDADTFLAGDFPCFARGVSHRGPYKDGPGEVNVPVSVGGQVVMPADIVVGDADGVVVIPFDHAESVLDLAQKKELAEAGIKAQLRNGTYTKAWVDATLAMKREGK